MNFVPQSFSFGGLGVAEDLIALACGSIAVTIFCLLRKRPTLPARGLMAVFAAFLLACGITYPVTRMERTEQVAKAITAVLAVAAAIAAIKLVPAVLRMPSHEEVERANQYLLGEMRAHADAEARLRQAAETARVSSEGRMHSYFEAASQGILAVSSNGTILMVNRRMEEMFGYSREEMIGANVEMLLPNGLRAKHAGHRAGFFAEPRVRAMGAGMDLAGRRKDASEFPIEIGLSFTKGHDGIVALGLVSDITERKHAEGELRRADQEARASEETLRSYLEAAPQAILATSADGRIVLVNRRTEQMFGYQRSELLGQEIEMLLPARFRAAHRAMRAHYHAEPVVRAMESRRELTALSKQGMEFPVQIGLSYVPTEHGLLALSLISDVTDRKLAADELARVNDALRRSNAELEQFAYIASHDLQEPLRMISGYLDLLRRRYADRLDGDAQEFIQFAIDGAARMKGLIRDVLSFSRISTRPLAVRPVESSEVLRTALENLQVAIAERHAEITCGELPEIVADAGLLTQVFQNLIGNAIKFTREGTPRVSVSAVERDGEWVFSIEDNGIGIDPAHAERIFRIFERLNPEESSGAGVGLAVCKKIVERHGGRIWVGSQPGQGSIFSFTIPGKKSEFPRELKSNKAHS